MREEFEDLMIEFDEYGFAPTITMPNAEEFAINYKKRLVQAINDLEEENQILKASPPIISNRGYGKTIRAKLLMFDKLKEEHDNLIKENTQLKGKETPKKVTHEATIFTANTCPNCANVVGSKEEWGESLVEIHEEYCKFCGQHLDWGNSNE